MSFSLISFVMPLVGYRRRILGFSLIGFFMPSTRMTYAVACMSYATACKCVYVYVPASRCPWARYELLSSPSLNAFASEARQRASVDGPGWIHSNLLASCSQVILPLLPHPPPACVCICVCVHACGIEPICGVRASVGLWARVWIYRGRTHLGVDLTAGVI